MKILSIYPIYILLFYLLNYILINNKILLDNYHTSPHKKFLGKNSVPISGGILFFSFILIYLENLIFKDLNIEIDFAYLLSDWFFEKKYKSAWRKDTLVYEQILKYLDTNNINVFRKEIPLDYLFPDLNLL